MLRRYVEVSKAWGQREQGIKAWKRRVRMTLLIKRTLRSDLPVFEEVFGQEKRKLMSCWAHKLWNRMRGNVIDLRLSDERKCPQKICIIVKKEHIILITKRTRNRGCPQITVNNIKRHSTMRIGRKERQFNLFAHDTWVTYRRGRCGTINGLRGT